MSEALMHFQQMIKALNPDLQNQFLSAAFDRYAPTDDISNAARLIDGLGAEFIVRMLHQASLAGKQISPSLIAFVNNQDESGSAFNPELVRNFLRLIK